MVFTSISGIPALLAASTAGTMPTESAGITTRASVPLAMDCSIKEICSSLLSAVAGASTVRSTPASSAAFSAPSWTAIHMGLVRFLTTRVILYFPLAFTAAPVSPVWALPLSAAEVSAALAPSASLGFASLDSAPETVSAAAGVTSALVSPPPAPEEHPPSTSAAATHNAAHFLIFLIIPLLLFWICCNYCGTP